MLLCHCINQWCLYITKSVFLHSQKPRILKWGKWAVSSVCVFFLSLSLGYRSRKSRVMIPAKLVVGDPIFPGGVVKGNAGCLKPLGMQALDSFLPSLWVRPRRRMELPCPTSHHPVSHYSETNDTSQKIFVKVTVSVPRSVASIAFGFYIFHCSPSQRKGSLLSIFCTNKACQILWYCSQTWRWYEHWICLFRWGMSWSHGYQGVCRDVPSNSKYSMILCLCPCWFMMLPISLRRKENGSCTD